MSPDLRPPQTHRTGERRALDRQWLDHLEQHPNELPLSGEAGRHPWFQQAVEQWNTGAFHASHETWEEVWRAEPYPSRLFYLAMAKLAAALEQARRGKHNSAAKLVGDGLHFLAPFQPTFLGLDTQLLSRKLEHWTHQLRNSQNASPPQLHTPT